MSVSSSHWDKDGKCSCPLDGLCGECGLPCTDHDLVGNSSEFGMPTYWCGACINRHWNEDFGDSPNESF